MLKYTQYIYYPLLLPICVSWDIKHIGPTFIALIIVDQLTRILHIPVLEVSCHLCISASHTLPLNVEWAVHKGRVQSPSPVAHYESRTRASSCWEARPFLSPVSIHGKLRWDCTKASMSLLSFPVLV